ncbi:MAG: extracellular solute-binding protein [Candidatus Pacebacteria bacterium]|nr:extracellular solute-binding protein [Candidatus Paceibacterota bacterium]
MNRANLFIKFSSAITIAGAGILRLWLVIIALSTVGLAQAAQTEPAPALKPAPTSEVKAAPAETTAQAKPQAAIGPKPLLVSYHAALNSGDRQFYAEIIERWNRLNPDTPAFLLDPPKSEMTSPLRPLIAPALGEAAANQAIPNNLPDIVDNFGSNFAVYAWAGAILPLNDPARPLIDINSLQDFLPSVLLQGIYDADGLIYSLATTDNGVGLWGRRSQLNKIGMRIPTSTADAWNGEEFLTALDRLSKLSDIDYALDLRLSYPSYEWYSVVFIPWLQMSGGDIINRNSWKAEGVLNSKESQNAMTLLQSLRKRPKLLAPPDFKEQNFREAKNVGLAYSGHWDWPLNQQALGDDLVLMPLPRLGQKTATTSGSWGWSITRASRRPAVAAKLLQYLVSPDIALEYSNRFGAVPSRLSAIDRSSFYRKGGVLEILSQQLKEASSRHPLQPAYPGNLTVRTVFTKAIVNIIAGRSVALELDHAATIIDADSESHNNYIKLRLR